MNYLLTPLAINAKDAKNCRRFSIEAKLGAKVQASKGIACRDAGGTWKMR